MADFALVESPKLISRKIWMIEKSWNFHTVSEKICLDSYLYSFWVLPRAKYNSTRVKYVSFKTHVYVVNTQASNLQGSTDGKFAMKLISKMTIKYIAPLSRMLCASYMVKYITKVKSKCCERVIPVGHKNLIEAMMA